MAPLMSRRVACLASFSSQTFSLSCATRVLSPCSARRPARVCVQPASICWANQSPAPTPAQSADKPSSVRSARFRRVDEIDPVGPVKLSDLADVTGKSCVTV
jgi:hypothetical protein